MTKIDRWPGLYADTDPQDNPGSQVQENCSASAIGKLTGRKGMREVWIGNATARESEPTLTNLSGVMACASFQRPGEEVLVWLEEDGTVRYGRKIT